MTDSPAYCAAAYYFLSPTLVVDFVTPDTLALIELIIFLVCGWSGVSNNDSQILATSSY